jgi:hypothetical protein
MNSQTDTVRPVDLHAWDEAFRRVESYLRAHGVESRVQLNSLTTEIIGAAQSSAAARDGGEPVTLAMREANARIGAWFERLIGTANGDDARFHARGRLAVIMAEVPRRWPQHFLSPDPLPEDLIAAVNSGSVQAGPEVRFTNMAPQRIEFSAPPGESSPRPGFPRGPLLRAAAMWMLIIGLLGVTWAASHH